MCDMGGFEHHAELREPAISGAPETSNASAPRGTYRAPVLVALDLRVTQGDTGRVNDGAFGSLRTSGGGPA